MSGMDRQAHWEAIYARRAPDEVSWFQPHATVSMDIIRSALPDRDAHILEVGGGASLLVDDLLDAGYRRVTVLDLAPSALGVVRSRLGPRARAVSFVQGDITTVALQPAGFALWHDRAVFHFLTDEGDRRRYLDQVRRAVVPGGLVLVATFAEDGPTQCSGLKVVRYSPGQLHAVLGHEFDLVDSRREEHRTPGGAVQHFTYCLLRLP